MSGDSAEAVSGTWDVYAGGGDSSFGGMGGGFFSELGTLLDRFKRGISNGFSIEVLVFAMYWVIQGMNS